MSVLAEQGHELLVTGYIRKIEELEKQVQQLRSSVESARATHLVSPGATHESVSVTGSSFSVLNTQPYCPSPLANQALSETPRMENRGVDELSLPPHFSELSSSNRRASLPQASPAGSSPKLLDHVTLSQNQIDTMFQM